MVSALLDTLQVIILSRLVQGIPYSSVQLSQIRSHIDQNSIHEPGVNILGSIQAHMGKAGTLRTVIVGPVSRKGTYSPLIAAGLVFTDRPAVLHIDALFEDHLLSDRFIILLLVQETLVQHLVEHVHLAVAVAAGAVPDLSLIGELIVGIGIEKGRVVGDTDQTGALRDRKALELFSEVCSRGALHTIAALAQVDTVQVVLHDRIFIIFLFEHLRPEDLHDLSLDGNALLAGDILDQLLGDGRSAELGIAAEEHIDAGLDGRDPVNALMLVETLIFDGYSSIDQRLGDLLQRGPLTVGRGIDLLELLDIAGVIYIIYKGSLFQVIVIHGPVGSLRQDIFLQIVAQRANENNGTNEGDQNYGRSGPEGDLKKGPGRGAKHIQDLQGPMGLPLLARFLILPSFEELIVHIIDLHHPCGRHRHV